MKKFAMIWGLLAMLVIGPAFAQPLADRVPDDAVIYVGWQGTRTMGEAYGQSNLNGLIKDANLSLSLDRAVTMLAQMADREQPGAGKIFTLWQKLGATGWEHPWAFYFGGVDFNGNNDMPTPRVALLIDGGKDANAIATNLNNELAASIPGGAQELANAPFGITTVGSLVVIGSKTLAQDAPALSALINGKGGKTITADATFAGAMKKVPAGSVAVAYINTEKLLAMVDQAVAVSQEPQAIEMWPKIREATGLSGLNHVVWGGNFVGKNWQSITYVDAPAPRRGLVKLLDSKPLSKEAVNMIPANVTWASAMNFDIAAMYDEFIIAATKIDPQAGVEIKQGVAQASQEAGFDIESHVIRALGSEWITYSDANAGGFMGMGFTMANRTKNPAAVGQLLTRIEQMANQMGVPNMPMVQVMDQGNIKVYFTAAAGVVTPAWALHEGNLYISMAPQGVTAAAQRGSKVEGSILQNAAFAAELGKMQVGDKYSQIAFTDLEKTIPQTYQSLQMGLAMAARQMPEAGQVMGMLPPLTAVMPYVGPVTTASWSDDKGVYLRTHAPFPGAAAMGSSANPQTLMMFGGIGAAAFWLGHQSPVMIEPGMIEVVPNAPQ